MHGVFSRLGFPPQCGVQQEVGIHVFIDKYWCWFLCTCCRCRTVVVVVFIVVVVGSSRIFSSCRRSIIL
jgi:hypothetical protein